MQRHTKRKLDLWRQIGCKKVNRKNVENINPGRIQIIYFTYNKVKFNKKITLWYIIVKIK